MAGRSGPWLAVRAPAVYGPGDRETLAYFRAVARGLAPRPSLPDARLSLIHVADLAEALALAVERPPPASVYEIDDGRDGGYGYGDMAAAAEAGLGRTARSLAIPRLVMDGVAPDERLGHALGGPPDPDPGQGAEIFHRDWTVHDRRLAAAIGFAARYDLATASPTRSCGIAGTSGSRACVTLRNKLLFHKESRFCTYALPEPPGPERCFAHCPPIDRRKRRHRRHHRALRAGFRATM